MMMSRDTTEGAAMVRGDLWSEHSERLRQAIRDSGKPLNQLGSECGIDRGRLSRFMRGERDLTGAAIGRLAEALGLKLVAGETAEAVKPASKPKRRWAK
jgi:transcriptional regulator with XRE-family HTH domain